MLTDEYRQIREATPHIRYKTPVYMWVLLAVVLTLFAVLMGFALFSAFES